MSRSKGVGPRPLSVRLLCRFGSNGDGRRQELTAPWPKDLECNRATVGWTGLERLRYLYIEDLRDDHGGGPITSSHGQNPSWK